jgi:hypothetical protein
MLTVAEGVDQAAGQWTTIEPEHRGHRLGMLLKVANLRFAAARAGRDHRRHLER